MGKIIGSYANTVIMTDNLDSALVMYKVSLDYHESNNDELSAAIVKHNMGMVYSRRVILPLL